MIKKWMFFFTFMLTVTFLHAQVWTYYNSLNTSTELSSNYIRDIEQDADGSLWFGGSGVSHYDGVEWTRYTKFEGLLSNTLFSIEIDSSGNKWFGTIYGLSMFDGSNWTGYTTADGLADNFIQTIEIDGSGIKWIATLHGLSMFDGTNWTTYTEADGLVDDYIFTIAFDKDGNKWFGTMNGVSKFDGAGWTTYTTIDGLANDSVYDIAVDEQGVIWFGTGNGLSRYDGSNWTTYTTADGLAENFVISIAFDEEGAGWFGTYYNGVSRFDGVNFTNYGVADGLAGEIVIATAFDDEGNKWFGTWDGVSKFDGVNWTTYTRKGGLTDNYATAITEDSSGHFWIGTADSGVCKFDGQSWDCYQVEDGLAGNSVMDLHIDSQDNTWVGTTEGVSVYDGSNWVTYTTSNGLTDNTIEQITHDASGKIWLATHGGVNIKDGPTWTALTSADGLVDNYLSAIAIDAYNNKWFASRYDGVSWYDGVNWKTYTMDDGLLNYLVYAAAIDPWNNVWFGTAWGLSKFDGDQWVNFTSIPGLDYDDIRAIVFDAEGNAWIGTIYGASRFDGISWVTYTNENGLPSNYVFEIFIDGEGNKWFATGFGVAKLQDGGPGPLIPGNLVTGMVFQDDNLNGVRDPGEAPLPGRIVQIDEVYSATGNDGFFHAALQNGEHPVLFSPGPYWQLTTDSLYVIDLNGNDYPDTLFFGIVPLQYIHDVSVVLAGTRARPGMPGNYWMHYRNDGTVAQDGSVAMVLDSQITFLYSEPAPDTVDANRLAWNFSSLQPGEWRQVFLRIQNPGTATIGDTMVSAARITIINPDADPSNNSDTLRSEIRSSWDPNDKLVNEGIEEQGYVLSGTPLTYTLRFQNTGNDTAFYVAIRDTLDPRMDMATLKILASSHPVRLEVRGSSEATYYFEDILLPDSNVNESASHGYITFRVSPKAGLANFTRVSNKAHIYFDQNAGVTTNEVINTYVSTIPPPFSIPEKTDHSLVRIYPNPSNGKFMIELMKKAVEKVCFVVYNNQGQKIISEEAGTGTISHSLSLSSFPPGIYLLKVTIGTESSMHKIILIR